MSRHRKSGFTSVFTFDDFFKICNRNFMLTDVNQCSHNSSHHISQKTISRNRKDKMVFFLLPKSLKNNTIIRKNICIRFRKTLKIIVFKQNFTSLVHFLNIQRIEKIPAQILFKNIFLKMNMILIGSFDRIKTSMSLVMHFKNRKNRYILWQKRIEFFDQPVRYFLFEIKMSIHFCSMHSAVCTTGSNELQRGFQQKRQSLCECLLYRNCIGL